MRIKNVEPENIRKQILSEIDALPTETQEKAYIFLQGMVFATKEIEAAQKNRK